MGLDDFKEDKKTSTPSNASGPSEGGVESFIEENSDGSKKVGGGFEINLEKEDDYDTEVIKVFGGPGTGKTTTIVGNTEIPDFKGILQRMFEEYNPHNLLLIAYTRAAADEAKERLVKLTDTTKTLADDRMTTIHSYAMGANNLRPQDIVEIRYANDKYNFCQQVGLEYNKDSHSDEEDMMAEPEDEGHLFFDMVGWLKSSLKPPSEWEDCPLSSDWDRSGKEFIKFAALWDKYKNEKGIWEFDDAILECVNNGDTVDADFVFVDEVQDLYPLQQAFLDEQFGSVKRIFLAGDDDQTIYGWAGARPEYFLEMEGKVNDEMPELWEDKAGYWQDEGVYILDQSWRMPDNILELAKMCIEKVDNRQEKEIKPHHEGGNFVPLHNPNADEVINMIDHDDTKILFRAKYQIGNFADKLLDAGIPYHDYRFRNSSYGTWDDDTLNLRNALAAIKNKKNRMTGAQAAKLMEQADDQILDDTSIRSKKKKEFSRYESVEVDDVVDLMALDYPESDMDLRRWVVDFDDLNWYKERAVRNNILKDKEHLVPDGLDLTTIHGSKGKEAGTIILSLSSTDSVQKNMPDDGIADSERRLYYVGMTRSEDTLVMCESMDKDSPTITVDELLGEEWRDMYDWANGPVYEYDGPSY